MKQCLEENFLIKYKIRRVKIRLELEYIRGEASEIVRFGCVCVCACTRAHTSMCIPHASVLTNILVTKPNLANFARSLPNLSSLKGSAAIINSISSVNENIFI